MNALLIRLCAPLLLVIPSVTGLADSDKLPHQDPSSGGIEYAIYGIRVPNTGTLEVKVQPTIYTTKAVLQFEDNPSLQEVHSGTSGATNTFNLSKGQFVYFNLINDPDNNHNYYWTTAYNPGATFDDKIQGWQTVSWDFSVGNAGGSIVSFRYKYIPPVPAPQLIACQGIQYYSPGAAPGFDRGFCSTTYCGNSPESWSRGRADINPTTGRLAMTLELETDSTVGGPIGKMSAKLLDANGNLLKSYSSDKQQTGGKRPGKSMIVDFPGTKDVDPAIAQKVAAITVSSECLGHHDAFWSVLPGDPKITVTVDLP
jgi:hypothetical protein